MGQLLGKSTPKEPPKTQKRTVSDKDKAVLKLKRARDRLTKFQKKVHTALALTHSAIYRYELTVSSHNLM